MASSLQLQLRAAIAALLADLDAPGGVHENRDFDMANGVASQVHVNLRRSVPNDQVVYTNHPRIWLTDFELVILARKTGSSEASEVADALWVAAYAALMGDQTLGGRASQILPGEAEYDDGQGDTSVCRLTWTFTVDHRTSNNTLTS